MVTAGLLNKQIAHELGVSEITVKVHRGNAMKKMDARSLADLVRMADSARKALADLTMNRPANAFGRDLGRAMEQMTPNGKFPKTAENKVLPVF